MAVDLTAGRGTTGVALCDAEAGLATGGLADQDQIVDIEALIDNTPMSVRQWLIILTCVVGAMADGMDIQIMAFAAPAIAKSLDLAPAALGPLLGLGIFGGFLGGLLLSPQADRIGVKPVLIASLGLFGVATFLTSFAQSLPALLCLRLIAAIGMGSALPALISYVAAASPRRIRSVTVVCTSMAVSVGAVLGGALVASTVEAHGWRLAFVVGGVAPLALLPIILLCFGEHPTLLVASGRPSHVIKAALARFGKSAYLSHARDFIVPNVERSASLKALFRGRAWGSFFLFAYVFVAAIFYFTLSSWLPYILVQGGLSVSDAAWGGTLLNIGGIAGSIAMSWLIGRKGPYVVMIAGYGSAAVVLLALATDASHAALFGLIFLCGITGYGAHFCQPALITMFYPARFHNSGMGLAMASGRIGGAIGPILAGALMGSSLVGGDAMLFWCLAVFAALAALMIALMRIFTRRAERTAALQS